MQKTGGTSVASGKAGDLVLADIRTVHRGSYWTGQPQKRISFWSEIYANSDETERLVINPAFLSPHPSQEMLDFLGVGRPGGTLRVHPADNSSLTAFALPRPCQGPLPVRRRVRLLPAEDRPAATLGGIQGQASEAGRARHRVELIGFRDLPGNAGPVHDSPRARLRMAG